MIQIISSEKINTKTEKENSSPKNESNNPNEKRLITPNNKTSRENKFKEILLILLFCIALLSVYGINKARWDIEGFFYGLGISESLFALLIPLILLIGFIILIRRLGFPGFLMVLGALLFFMGIFGIVYEKSIVSIIGVILFLIGLWWWRRRRNRALANGYPPSPQTNINLNPNINVNTGNPPGTTRPNRRRRGGRFNYSPGMRRGGTNSRRARFVSKNAAQRYARMHGGRAARRRFG